MVMVFFFFYKMHDKVNQVQFRFFDSVHFYFFGVILRCFGVGKWFMENFTMCLRKKMI